MKSVFNRNVVAGKVTGFTLIELLVVISIIALLMSILMPALGKVREQGQRVVCGANLKNLSLGVIMYADQYDGQLMSYVDAGPDAPGDWSAYWWGKLIPYMNQKLRAGGKASADYFKCPSEKDKSEGITVGTGDVENVDYGVPYGYRGTGIFTTTYWGPNANIKVYYSKNTNKIRWPSNVFMLMDSSDRDYFGIMLDSDYVLHLYPSQSEDSILKVDTTGDGFKDSTSSSAEVPYARSDMRHARNEGLMTAYFDGHVSHNRKEEWVKREHWVWKKD